MTELAKWWQTIKVSWVSLFTYRLNFLFVIVGPTLVFFLVKYSLWSSIYSAPGNTVIGGYTLSGMLQYHFWIMIVSLVGQGSNALKISEDMRMGRVSAYLIYPFQFWKFHTAGFFGWQIVELVIALLSILFVACAGFLPNLTLSHVLLGLSFASMVGCTWFALQFFMGILGFWLEETWMLRVSFQIASNFLSGAVVPLSIFPGTLRAILQYTPFPYLNSVPVQLLMGTYSGSIAGAFCMLLVWSAAIIVMTAFTWRAGIKLYSGAGI